LIRLGFTFGFYPNGLDFFYNGNLFCHATLKGYFILLDLDDSYNDTSSTFVPYFDYNLNLLSGMVGLAMWIKIE